MILPTIIANTSLDIFDVNFKVYVQEFENKEDCEIDIDHIRIDQLKNRYVLSFNKTYDDYEDNPISIFGELETYPIHENSRSGIRVATYVIKPIDLWIDFFNSLYQMCNKRWYKITTEPVIDENGFGFSEFDDIERYIINVYRDHGFDEEYYRSGLIQQESDDLELEKRRKRLLKILEQRLPPISNNEAPLQKPSIPVKPQDKKQLDQWFDYYHQCKAQGINYSLEELAGDVNLSYGYIRELHIKYKSRKEIT